MENKKHSYWETTSADVERVKDRLVNVVASLEAAAVELKNISAKPGFIFKYSGGKITGYAGIVDNIASNISIEFELNE